MDKSKKTYKVIISHKSNFSDPLILKSGDEIKVVISTERTSECEGWLWCKTNDNSGWIPESFLDRKGNSGVLLVNYDATELSVEKEELLTAINEESGWFLCENQKKERGWVPLSKVKIFAEK